MGRRASGTVESPEGTLSHSWTISREGNTMVLDFSDFSLMLLDLGEPGEDPKVRLVSPLGLGGEEESL